MIIRISQVKIKLDDIARPLAPVAARALKLRPEEILSVRIIKKSVDARDKRDVHFTLTVDVSLTDSKREERIAAASSAVHATVYRTFLAVLSTHGRCGCLTDAHITRLFTAAQTKGETVRHCTDAWTNARTKLGM